MICWAVHATPVHITVPLEVLVDASCVVFAVDEGFLEHRFTID